MRLSRVLLAFCTLILVAGLVLGLLSGFFVRLGREGLAALTPGSAASAGRTQTPGSSDASVERTGPAGDPTARANDPSSGPAPSPSGTGGSAQLPPSVLRVAGTNRRADPRQIRAQLAGLDRTGLSGVIGATVLDGTGTSVYAVNAGRALIPASSLKLLTSGAALSLLGPTHRFRTSVVAARPRQIVLVGGGDPYLAARQQAGTHPRRATLSTLAARTAADLKARGWRTVSLGFDDTLFAGPAWNRLWPAGYSDQVGPTSALGIRPKGANPAQTAAAAFAAALRAQGITVATIRRTKAPRAATAIAAVPSMTVQQIVTQLLLVSDNNAAEVMLRQVGLKAGRGGSINGGRRAVQAELTRLGVWSSGNAAYDGSGLARSSKISPITLVRLLRLASTPGGAELRGLLTGLPVAGVEGTLRTRFLDPTEHAADGLVRGKTGTLTGVRSLAGYLRTPDGTLLYYAVIVNEAKDDWIAEEWVEQVLTALSSCCT